MCDTTAEAQVGPTDHGRGGLKDPSEIISNMKFQVSPAILNPLIYGPQV